MKPKRSRLLPLSGSTMPNNPRISESIARSRWPGLGRGFARLRVLCCGGNRESGSARGAAAAWVNGCDA